MATFIEKTDNALCKQLNNFSENITKYKTLFNLSDDDINLIKKDTKAFKYVMDCQSEIQSFAKSFSSFKQCLRFGAKYELGNFPIPPIFNSIPPMPDKNFEKRFRKIIQRIRNNDNFSITIGEGLGIIAPVSIFNPSEGKPKFKVKYTTGGYPMLCWKKGKYHGVEIWKDTGSGYFKLDRDNSPNYTDKSKLPTIGSAAFWKYKMIYVYKDEIVGAFSDEISIVVYSEV